MTGEIKELMRVIEAARWDLVEINQFFCAQTMKDLWWLVLAYKY